MCGEAAADPALACVLVGLGVTSLSMAPAAIADVRAALAERDLRGVPGRRCARGQRTNGSRGKSLKMPGYG